MNPETIIAELRGINAWRRGGEEIEQPDPKHIGEVLDAAADSLASLIASNTTLRRERSEARAEVAQLKGALSLGQENCDAEYEALREERDEAKADLARMEEYLRNSGRNMDEAQEQIAERDANLTNLRARVAELEEKAQKFPWELAGKAKRLEQRNAELEKQNELLICDRARFPDKSCEVGNIIAAHIENLKSTSESNAEAWRWACVREKALKERNDELVAALRTLLEFAERVAPGTAPSPEMDAAHAALTRAESATPAPAKHPDDEAKVAAYLLNQAEAERAIDAARKQGGVQ